MTTCATASAQDLVEGLYRDNVRLVYHIVRQYIDNPADQEELVQEAYTKLVGHAAKLKKLKPPQRVTYLCTTAENLCFSFLKRANRYRFIHLTPEEWDCIGSLVLSLDERIMQNELKGEVGTMLAKLSERERRLLIGKYILEYSTKELAEMMHLTPENAATALFRAKKHAIELLNRKDSKIHAE